MSSVTMDPRISARRVEVRRDEGRKRLRRLAFTAAIATTALAIFVTLRSPLFDVDSIEVGGIEHTGIDDVLQATQPLKGQPLLEVDTSQAAEAIAALPWVDEVQTSTSFDGTLKVSIIEREAVAAVVGVDGWLLVDSVGRVLEDVEQLPAGLPLVDGAIWNASAGDWIPERALPGVEVASLLPSSLAAEVASVVPNDGLDLVLYGGGRVLLGDATDLDQKFLAVLTVLDQVPLVCLEYIDVRAPSVPVLTRLPECS